MDNEGKFDIELVTGAFANSNENGEVSLKKYIEAYLHLIKFFDLLGKLFSFVSSDVISKCNTLKHHIDDQHGSHYDTVLNMIEHEIEAGLITPKGGIAKTPEYKISDANGSRTLLRLHRAFHFIVKLFNDLPKAAPTTSMPNMAQEIYKNTLAEFHPWLMRKTVGLALYSLPNRSTLMSKFTHGDDEPLLTANLEKFVIESTAIYDIIQKIYEEKQILDLP